jgi:hypothetical protein
MHGAEARLPPRQPIKEDRCPSSMPCKPKSLIDGYDLFIAEAMANAGVTQILTDDGDYCTVPGIQVLTANRQAIDAAQAQGTLKVR